MSHFYMANSEIAFRFPGCTCGFGLLEDFDR